MSFRVSVNTEETSSSSKVPSLSNRRNPWIKVKGSLLQIWVSSSKIVFSETHRQIWTKPLGGSIRTKPARIESNLARYIRTETTSWGRTFCVVPPPQNWVNESPCPKFVYFFQKSHLNLNDNLAILRVFGRISQRIEMGISFLVIQHRLMIQLNYFINYFTFMFLSIDSLSYPQSGDGAKNSPVKDRVICAIGYFCRPFPAFKSTIIW